MENLKLFALPSAQLLGEKVAKQLKHNLTPIERTLYADGERILISTETVRNRDTYVIASLSTPVNDNLMELLLFVDSLKRASAKTITVVVTYYGYARQDRKAKGRQSIGAKLVADLLETAGITKMIVVELHNASIQGFFDVPVDDLKGQYVLASKIKEFGRFTVVSPDHGGAVRARILAELLSNSIEIAIVDKRRTGPNQSVVHNILGDIKGKNVVILDDMIDTGGTIIKAARALKAAGVKKILVAATHGLFSNGFQKFAECPEIDKVIVTDSVPKAYSIKSPKLEIVSLDEVLGATIRATQNSQSITQTYYQNIRNKLK